MYQTQNPDPRETAMRRRSALIAFLIAVMVTALAGPASAGGPTSVLLSAPETGQTASLHASGSDYHAMAELVSAFDMSTPADGKDASGQEHATGAVVTATWLIHDVQVWRVDRIYLDARGGPWIATQLDPGTGGSMWDQPVTWHVPENGKQLVALLEQLGVVGDSGGGTAGSTGPSGSSVGEPVAGSASSDGAATEESQPTASNRSEADETTGTPGLAWGLAGLALGVALALAAVRLAPSLRRGQRSVDERDADTDTDTDTDWALTDELSSVPR